MAYEKMSLEGRVAVVLGGTTGIGRALSLGLTEAGASVVASSRRSEQVEKVSAEIEALGGRTCRQSSDVTSRESLERLRDAVFRELEHVDILVNCAGITKRGATLDFPEADWNAILDCNLTGTLRGCQIFGQHMLERGYGRIINIASLSSSVAFHEVAGARGRVVYLALDHRHHGARLLMRVVTAIHHPPRPERRIHQRIHRRHHDAHQRRGHQQFDEREAAARSFESDCHWRPVPAAATAGWG